MSGESSWAKQLAGQFLRRVRRSETQRWGFAGPPLPGLAEMRTTPSAGSSRGREEAPLPLEGLQDGRLRAEWALAFGCIWRECACPYSWPRSPASGDLS